MGILQDNGLFRYAPDGTFYLLVDLASWKGDSLSFAKKLLEEEKVAVAPGETFGQASGHMVRTSFCTDENKIGEGLGRLCRFLRRL